MLAVVAGGSSFVSSCSPSNGEDAALSASAEASDNDTSSESPSSSSEVNGPAADETAEADQESSAMGGGPNAEGNGPQGSPAATDSMAGEGGSGANPPSMDGMGGSPDGSPGCPQLLGEAFPTSGAPAECSEPGSTCDVPFECTSGTRTLTVSCEDGEWQKGPAGCEDPYDFCPRLSGAIGPSSPSAYCVEGEWSVETYLFAVSHGPADCPAEPPAEDSRCTVGGTGGPDRQHCGYPCADDSSKWTVFTCGLASDEGPGEQTEGVWVSDGACN